VGHTDVATGRGALLVCVPLLGLLQAVDPLTKTSLIPQSLEKGILLPVNTR
jgi:hypothetical protein